MVAMGIGLFGRVTSTLVNWSVTPSSFPSLWSFLMLSWNAIMLLAGSFFVIATTGR